MTTVVLVLLCGACTSLVGLLKGWSLVQREIDVGPCLETPDLCDASQYDDLPVVDSSQRCVPALDLIGVGSTRFRLCRGGYAYEAVSVTLAEGVATILVGCTVLFATTPWRAAVGELANKKALFAVAPVGLLYAVNDLLDVLIYTKVSVAQASVVSQSRLGVTAILRWLVMGQGQTWTQGLLLGLISLTCVGFILEGQALSVTELAGSGAVFAKCVIRCVSAVYTELALGKMARSPLWVNQVHFKACTLLASVVLLTGRGGWERVLASTWTKEHHIPPGVELGDPRTPFFGGWSLATLRIAAFLVLNNFVIGSVLKRMSATTKYVGYASSICFSYCLTVLTKQSGAEFRPRQFGLALVVSALVIAYSTVTQPVKRVIEAKEKKAD